MKFLTRREAANYLRERGIPSTEKTLAKYATVGGGPIYQKFGPRALYTTDNLDAWADSRLSPPARSTAEHAAGTGR